MSAKKKAKKKKAKKKKAKKKVSTSCQWNLENPDRVDAARARYAEKQRKRRAKMSYYERQQEDLRSLVRRSKRKADRRRLLKWGLANLLDD